MTAQPHQYISPDEYLERELRAETRSEYVFGEIYAMSGTTWDHNLIVTNLIRELSSKLNEGPCRVVSNDMKVGLKDGSAYLYPDVLGLCSKPEFSTPNRHVLSNPELVIEVLSPGTQDYDRGKKRILYQSIATLREILFVSQSRPHIEHYQRASDVDWRSRFYVELADEIHLESMACTINLSAIYLNVEFTGEPLV